MRNQTLPALAVKEGGRLVHLYHLARALRECFVSEKQKKTW
jgi:hypothetical protein